ncbi:hypothetical protein [Streptomyces niveus]|uniref:hypothetical protein n=1 Tax=Streptomyces niveus TaxID=193462 RepID=UPI0036269575
MAIRHAQGDSGDERQTHTSLLLALLGAAPFATSAAGVWTWCGVVVVVLLIVIAPGRRRWARSPAPRTDLA